VAQRAEGGSRSQRLSHAVHLLSLTFPPAGRLLLGVMSVAGVTAAVISVQFPLYHFALLLFALLLVNNAAGMVLRPNVRVERSLPARCARGVTLEVRARVTNLGRLPALDLALAEQTPADMDGSAGPQARPRQYLRHLAPGATASLTYYLRAPRRGSHDLLGPIALTAFPFGLYQGRRRLPAMHRLLVYPSFQPLESLELPVGAKHQPGGLQMVSQVGDSEEFLGNREYRPGDRLRDLHHLAWARVGVPVVREFQQEYLCRIALVVDTHVPRRRSAGVAELEAGISLCAAVADALSRQEYVVDVFAAGPDLYHLQAGRSLAYLDDILDVLACLEPCRRSPFTTLAPALREEVAQISTAVVVLLDWDAERVAFVRALQEHGVEVKPIVVRSDAPSLDPRGFQGAAGPVQVLTPTQVERGVRTL
jgi:uncharacterized protein (DUF58 family)